MRERDEHARELQRAHQQIASLRGRVDVLERAVAAAYAALRPHAKATQDGPPRQCWGVSDSGMPLYADAPAEAGERQ
jgi:hypothetical protein